MNISPLQLLFSQTWARIAEGKPTAGYNELKEEVRNDLMSIGITRTIIEDLLSVANEDDTTIRVGGLLHPRFLQEKLKKKLFFFLIDARWGRYHALRAMLSNFQGDLSQYILYGPQDSLIGLFGSDTEAAKLRETLEDAQLEPTFIEIERISRFHNYSIDGYEMPTTARRISLEKINKLVDNYWTKELTEDERRLIAQDGLVIGPVVLEDLKSTGRIKAFVGINLIGRWPFHVTNDFHTYLLGKDSILSSSIRSVFQCKNGGPYHYFVQITCNNPQELDYVTDKISEGVPYGSGLETSTFVIASASERLPHYSTKETSLILDVSLELETQHSSYLRDIEQQYIAPLMKGGMRQTYLDLSQRERLFLLQALSYFQDYTIGKFKFTTHQDVDDSFTDSFINGFLLKSADRMSSAAMALCKLIENASKVALKEAVVLVYPERRLVLAQNDLKLPTASLDKLTLGQVWDAIRKINDHPKFQRLGLSFDEVFVDEFQIFTKFRNRAAHGVLDTILQDDFFVGSQHVYEAYRRAFFILQHFKTTVIDRDYLRDALTMALDETSGSSNNSLDEVLGHVKRIDFNLAEIDSRQRRLLRRVIIALTSLDHSVQSQLNQQLRIAEWLETQKTEVIQNADSEHRHQVESAVQTIINQGTALPANVFANLIANILAGLTQPYLYSVLEALSQFLR